MKLVKGGMAVLILASAIGRAWSQQPMTLQFQRNDSVGQQIFIVGKKSGIILTDDAISFVGTSVKTSSTTEYMAAIYRLPTVHVIVSPVPPRDYVVGINGKDYEASEESKYGFSPGTRVELIVKRGSMPPCVHKLVVTKDETVRCEL